MAYSGAWKSGKYQQPSLQGSVPALEHRQPEDTESAGTRNWQNAPEDPPIESGLEERTAFTVDATPGGPVFSPPGHDFGIGAGSGYQSWAASQAQGRSYAAHDDGSGFLTADSKLLMAQDGTYHVDRVQMIYPDEDGIRPAGTPDLPIAPGMSQGLNRAAYPNRRIGHYTPRWWDRVYERRSWNTEFRPVVVPNAYTAPTQGANPDGNQYTSPYAAAQSTNVRVVTTSAPQMRRTPTPWDESITVDGTSGNVAGQPDYGFASF